MYRLVEQPEITFDTIEEARECIADNYGVCTETMDADMIEEI